MRMPPYPSHRGFDIGPFKRGHGSRDTRYGLPEEVAFCRSCVIFSERPNSTVEYVHTRHAG